VNELASTLFVLRLVKLVLEIAILSLIGQGVLWMMIRAVGRDPRTNFAWRVLDVVVSPFVRLLRLITPKFVAERHLPWAVLGLLAVGWFWVTFAIGNACISQGVPIADCRNIR
jgi:hypothetical protein